jgi:hypothetical protein
VKTKNDIKLAIERVELNCTSSSRLPQRRTGDEIEKHRKLQTKEN